VARDENDPRPLWQLVPIAALSIVLWPIVMAPSQLRALRFHRVVRRAAGTQHRIVDGGVEVWREGEAPKQLGWEQLANAHWLVHATPTMASGDEESCALELPGVALGGYRNEIDPILTALAERDLRPELHDGGRGLGFGGWLITMLWLACVAGAAVAYVVL
jgi:hypothetical protein